jgi:hypothetical protein
MGNFWISFLYEQVRLYLQGNQISIYLTILGFLMITIIKLTFSALGDS